MDTLLICGYRSLKVPTSDIQLHTQTQPCRRHTHTSGGGIVRGRWQRSSYKRESATCSSSSSFFRAAYSFHQLSYTRTGLLMCMWRRWLLPCIACCGCVRHTHVFPSECNGGHGALPTLHSAYLAGLWMHTTGKCHALVDRKGFGFPDHMDGKKSPRPFYRGGVSEPSRCSFLPPMLRTLLYNWCRAGSISASHPCKHSGGVHAQDACMSRTAAFKFSAMYGEGLACSAVARATMAHYDAPHEDGEAKSWRTRPPQLFPPYPLYLLRHLGYVCLGLGYMSPSFASVLRECSACKHFAIPAPPLL